MNNIPNGLLLIVVVVLSGLVAGAWLGVIGGIAWRVARWLV